MGPRADIPPPPPPARPAAARTSRMPAPMGPSRPQAGRRLFADRRPCGPTGLERAPSPARRTAVVIRRPDVGYLIFVAPHHWGHCRRLLSPGCGSAPLKSAGPLRPGVVAMALYGAVRAGRRPRARIVGIGRLPPLALARQALTGSATAPEAVEPCRPVTGECQRPLVRKTGRSPATAWRARILTRT